AGDRAPDSERLVALGRVEEGGGEQRHGRGGEQRAERALEGPRHREHAERLRGATDRRGDREPGEAGDERPLAAEQVADPPAEQEQAPEGQCVGGDDPLPVGVGEVQGPLSGGQRDVHNRRVEYDHQLGEREDHEDRPALGVVGVGGHSKAPEIAKWISLIRLYLQPTAKTGYCQSTSLDFSAMPRTQASERPLRKDAERNRQRILDAARELFALEGVGVTLNDVAHHAGVGVGTVYRRFPEKTQLVEELFEQQVSELVRLMEEALDDPDPWRGLTGFLRRNLELQARDRAFRQIIVGSPEAAQRINQIRGRMFPLGARLVQRAKDAGALPADFQPSDMPMPFLVLTAVLDAPREVEPDLWRRYLEVFIQGLRADPTPPDPLATPALGGEQVPAVMGSFKLPRR